MNSHDVKCEGKIQSVLDSSKKHDLYLIKAPTDLKNLQY